MTILEGKLKLLTPEQAAEALSISHRHLIHLTDDGELPFINIGRGMRKIRRYEPADIEAFKTNGRPQNASFHPKRQQGRHLLV
ncbi:helix-turn-helix domain-containing protein [Ochrobactrum pseudogrignonense]|nr:helix-turn-helix domain-containing protein [Brucella pseudogrignonensis]